MPPPLPRISVVVVSRHRPARLALCLASLSQQDHPDFEVILVADPGSVLIRPDLGLRRIVFDVANISRARNIGLSRAAGQVVAFIDDDAVAEPTWLSRLTAPFGDGRVVAAAGFTRGPDGLGWQVRAERIGRDGRARSLPLDGGQSRLFASDPSPVSTIGTNCAFRRQSLVDIGGFDPDFRFHLDESDVNLRLARRHPGALTAVVPMAQVIHGLAAGPSRLCNRAPADLTDIGRSHAIFARKHNGSDDWVAAHQRRRLIRDMQAGRLDPFVIGCLMQSLRAGQAAGRVAPIDPPQRRFSAPPAFRAMGSGFDGHVFLHGWLWQASGLRRRAAGLVGQGRRVTLLLISPSFVPHRRRLVSGGWWEQQGGLWGRAAPDDGIATFRRAAAFCARVAKEAAQLREG